MSTFLMILAALVFIVLIVIIIKATSDDAGADASDDVGPACDLGGNCPPGRSPTGPRHIAKPSSIVSWIMVFGGTAIGMIAMRLEMGAIQATVVALVGSIILWMNGCRPHQGTALIQAFMIAAVAYTVLALVSVFTLPRQDVWPVILSAVVLFFNLWLFTKGVRNVPTKHYAPHSRQGKLTGILLPKGGPYCTLAFFDGMGETDDSEPDANNGPISEELRLFEVEIPVEIDGRVPAKVPFFIQFHADSMVWNVDGENVFYMLKVSDLKGELLDAFAPYVRAVAASVTTYKEFNKVGEGINLWLQFVLETGIEPHRSESFCRDHGIPVEDLVITDPDGAKIAKFYMKHQALLQDALEKVDRSERSHIEWALGIRVGGAGAGVRDVAPPPELETAMIAKAAATEHAVAAREFDGIPQGHVDNVFVGQGNSRIKRIVIAGDEVDPLSRAAMLHREGAE